MNNDFMHDNGWVAVALIASAIVVAVTLIIHIFVCWLLYTISNRIPARFRLMDPGLVWLLLIPCFYMVWNFFVYPKLSRGFKAYFESVNDATVGDCGLQIGTFYAVAVVCTLLPCVNYVAGPAAIVLLIVYLIKVNELSKKIPAGAT